MLVSWQRVHDRRWGKYRMQASSRHAMHESHYGRCRLELNWVLVDHEGSSPWKRLHLWMLSKWIERDGDIDRVASVV